MKTRLLTLCLLITFAVIAPRSAIAQQTEYRAGPQDVLAVTVFGEADLTGKYSVEQDGTFVFPLIGRVQAGGSTLREVEGELRKRLADGYLRNPQITVGIETYRSQRVLIIGEVRNPGEYQVSGDTSLLSALARAGSTTPAASREAVIMRSPKLPNGEVGPVQVIKVDLADLQAGDLTKNVQVLDGDTVNVPKAQMVFLSGQERSPGAYAVESGTTVLQALTLAGGLTDRGSDGRIRILRTVKGKKAEIKAKLTDAVLPGDTIVVPERLF
jgi:polysaccharide export outer membrane protein